MRSGSNLYSAEITFDTIYQLAKDKEEKKLISFLKNDYCLHIQHANRRTPILLLAKEGNFEAVYFLIQKFDANKDWAVYGAAEGGHFDFMYELITLGASIDYAAEGAAKGGYFNVMNQLIHQGAGLDFALYGAAQSGYQDTIKDLINRGADKSYAAAGTARGGHFEIMSQYITEAANKNNAVKCAAIGGHFAIMSKLIDLGASINYAVSGAAFGGDFLTMDLLISMGADINIAVKSAALGGHIDVMNQLLKKGAGKNFAITGAVHGGHFVIMNKLIKKGASKHTAIEAAAYQAYCDVINQLVKQGAMLDQAVWGAEKRPHLTKLRCLQFISGIDSPTLRQKLAIQANKEDNSIDVDVLLKKAERRNKIMKEYQLNYHQAQALTVSNLRIWTLNLAPQLIHTHRMITDVFYLITRYMTGLSLQDTNLIIFGINQKLFSSMSRFSFFSLFKPIPQIDEKEVLQVLENKRKMFNH